MNYEWFNPELFIILLAVGLPVSLIVAANRSVRSKREGTTAKENREKVHVEKVDT